MPPADHPGPLVFVESLDDPVLSDADRHHLERVRRIRAGSAITMADGFGRWRTGVLAADLETTGPVEEEPPPHPPLTIGFALVKGDKPELIVQKLTELGIDRVVPFRAERSVVRWDDEKAAKAVARLRTVARSAASQCHRARLPIIDELTDLRALAQEPGVAMADRDGDPPSLDHPVVLIGPEGGWAQEERTLGVPRVALGDHIL
ncbi:MAG: RsmE family RNA methyltransferase, partial [Acidimicrobiales bacterium]